MPLWVQRTLPSLARAGRQLLRACYPPACASCGGFLEDEALLCAACESALDELRRPACRKCAAPLAHEGTPCPWCKGKGLYPFDRIARLTLYQEPMRGLIHQFKYHRRWPMGERLADQLAEEVAVWEVLQRAEVLVPVPLHFLRYWQRGYNQAEVLAQRLAGHCAHRAKVVRAVSRIRHTPTQTQLTSATARRRNVKRAFALVRPDDVAGRHVVVVDDVITSGGTVREVGRMLMHARPASLCAVALAVADPKGRGFQRV